MGRHGRGGITKRKGGLLQVALTFPGGRRVFRYTRDPKEAERLRDELIAAREDDRDPSRLTLEAFLRSWVAGLRDARRQRIRPTTLRHYEMIVDQHILGLGGLGKHRLDRLREHHVQAWLDADPAAAPRTIHHHRAVLRRALNVAVRRRLITANPAVGVELPDAEYSGASPLSFDEVRKLLEATADDRLHPLWRLAIDTGLRQAELLGLAREDVDLDAGTVTVRAQLQRLPGRRLEDGTREPGAWQLDDQLKAGRELKRLSLAPSTTAALREHRRRMTAERTPRWRYFGLVFPTAAGEPYSQSVILRAFHAACDQAGIPRRRFHDLRHTTATLMRELGVAEDTRMARLGHSTRDMARRYGHAAEVVDRAAAELLEKAISG